MRESGDQAKTAYDNLQLCEVLEAGIEGSTHSVGQMRMERAKQRRSKEEAGRPEEEEDGDEEARDEGLTVET